MKKIDTTKKSSICFYWQGWRYGKIVKRYSKNRMTVRDCAGRRYRVYLNENEKWVAMSDKDYKQLKSIKKEKKHGKKIKVKIKGKRKRRFKVKIKGRKLRKS